MSAKRINSSIFRHQNAGQTLRGKQNKYYENLFHHFGSMMANNCKQTVNVGRNTVARSHNIYAASAVLTA
jgi:hypothetical protein